MITINATANGANIVGMFDDGGLDEIFLHATVTKLANGVWEYADEGITEGFESLSHCIAWLEFGHDEHKIVVTETFPCATVGCEDHACAEVQSTSGPSLFSCGEHLYQTRLFLSLKYGKICDRSIDLAHLETR